MRRVLNRSGDASARAFLMTTNVVPHTKVMKTNRRWALRERDTIFQGSVASDFALALGSRSTVLAPRSPYIFQGPVASHPNSKAVGDPDRDFAVCTPSCFAFWGPRISR